MVRDPQEQNHNNSSLIRKLHILPRGTSLQILRDPLPCLSLSWLILMTREEVSSAMSRRRRGDIGGCLYRAMVTSDEVSRSMSRRIRGDIGG
jgi:hypothetical protein